MIHQQKQALENFKNYVAIKFQLYNSLFTSLPFHRIEKTGILLSLFQNNCEEGYKKKWSPVHIVDDFFTRVATFKTEQEQLDLLFRFTQYVERQIVLFDALEDAAFKEVHDMQGMGTMKQLETEVDEANLDEQLVERLNDTSIRLVLTAHPTQFYPGTVLGIINDLAKGLKDNNTIAINTYLQQLGKTPFLNKQRPTPYDEAVSLIWYLENVFYYAAGRIVNFFKRRFNHSFGIENKIISLGFWPGGDRDGNPNVTSDITLKVAEALRSSIIKCYYLDVRKLKRRLTFKGIDVLLSNLEKKLYNNIFIPGQITELSVEEILKDLNEIREIVVYQHNGLFVDLLDSLITKVELFGLHFAALDVRQDSGIHNMVLEAIAEKETCLPKNYAELSDEEKMEVLLNVEGNVNPSLYEDALNKDSLLSFRSIATIQKLNGEPGCNRYIISHCNSALNMLEVYALFLLNGWDKETLTIDIIPLFETINDLKEAAGVMRQLYENHTYREHLRRRHNKQVIMVGFSDGTKDGGYLMANWSIYKAKEELSALAEEYEIEVAFFDGRGGPPARGGGKTHKFYASMGRNISQKEIQLTIQGQTISSNFGTIDSAQYNIEQLLNAGISNSLFSVRKKTVTDEEEALLQEMADLGYESYKQLKENPYFIQYLEQVSPLNFYMETNIGSRPAKRNKAQLNLDNLRAIPFVGAWSQLKQNVPGFYGVGTALRKLEEEGKLPQLKRMYQTSMFFETLIDNCEMAMKKCFFPLTAYLADHPQYGEIWTAIFEEFELTQQYIFKLTGNNELMSNYPVEQMSIQMRERIVLPLNTIQQYAISRLREAEKKPTAPLKEVYEKLIIRSSFGIINAARNSA